MYSGNAAPWTCWLMVCGISSRLLVSTEFVDALPTAFMRQLSGSGAKGMMVETMNPKLSIGLIILPYGQTNVIDKQ